MESKNKRARVGPKDAPAPLEPFPHPFLKGGYATGQRPHTRVEQQMVALSAAIRSKSRWWEKMKDPEILKKWRQEAEQAAGDSKTSKAIVDYVMEELSWYDSLREGSMQAATVDGVWQTDDFIPSEVLAALKAGVAKLEDIPESEKDWHPGTNEQVWDLVHPSLYCLVFGVSRQTPDGEEARPWHKFIGTQGEICRPPKYDKPDNDRYWYYKYPKNYTLSERFQWLPSEFAVDQDGGVVIRSYINNLHPVEHQDMYPAIARIFERFVPLFNRVLTDLKNPRPARVNTSVQWYDDEPRPRGYNKEDFHRRWQEWNRTKIPTIPLLEGFGEPAPPKDPVDLRGRTLQVIVKLANIVLTPEKPEYPGGAWHVEGMENEHIVASGIYYYDVSNITESLLEFRQAISEPNYEQNDNRGVELVYGLSDTDPLNQHLGGVITQEGRCIAFPNLLQHRVAPFALQDRTKPGHRKILVFFLVDPAIHVISTATVPPQQHSWLMRSLLKAHLFPPALPPEMVAHIGSYLDWPMSLDDAKKYREELMKERKYFIDNNNAAVFEREFSLCEH